MDPLAEPRISVEDGPLATRTIVTSRRSRSTKMPASPTACGPRARPPKRSRPATAAPAPRSTRRCRSLMISRSPPRKPGRLCRAARGIGGQGAGPRADDPDREARLRDRLRQGAADRIRGGSVLCAAPADRDSATSRTSSSSSRAGSRRWSPPSARPAGPSRSPTPKATLPAPGCARPPPISLADVPAAEEFAVVVTRRGADGRHEPVAIVDDEALIERAIRKRRLNVRSRGCPVSRRAGL